VAKIGGGLSRLAKTDKASTVPRKLASLAGLEPAIRALNRVCWVPPCFPKLPSHPLSALSHFHLLQPVPHFPDSLCLVLKPTRLLLQYLTDALSHLLNATLPSSTL
jgi:hypothetical protein